MFIFTEKNSRLGNELTKLDQRQVLSQFVHRFTGEHIPEWSKKEWKNGHPYPLQFLNDADWLEHTRFAVNKNNSLQLTVNYCKSTPTWPNNPELRKDTAP